MILKAIIKFRYYIMKKKPNNPVDDLVETLKSVKPVYVRLMIYPAGTQIPGGFTYRNQPCHIRPDKNGKFYTDCADNKSEYNDENCRVRWGRLKYLKRHGHLLCS